MHVCMIDEKPHHSQRKTEVSAKANSFLLENVHPSKVFVTSTGVNPSFSSQEPRRPRFSFFYLHNVKELTSDPLAGQTSVAASLPEFLENKTTHPVARQIVRPFRKR